MKFPIISVAIMMAVASVSGAAVAQQNASTAPASVTAENQRDWNRGSRLEADGLKELGEAEQVLVRRSADVVNLENQRDSATSQAMNAKRAFDTLRAQPEIIDPDQARTWAQDVADAAKSWEDFDDRVQSSSSLESASRRLVSAQEDVAKAQEKVNRGRVMMAAAERLSRPAGTQ